MMGQVEGHTTRFLLDSAADHSLINASFVRQLGTFGKTMPQPTSTVRVKGVQGKIVELLVIKLACHLLGEETQTVMAVSDDICHDVLFRNCPLLFKLLHAATDDNIPETLAVTRQQQEEDPSAELETEKEKFQLLEELVSEQYDYPQTNLSLQNPDLEKEQQSKRQIIATAQLTDPTLIKIIETAKDEDSPFVWEEQILQRQTVDQTGSPYNQIVLPKDRRLTGRTFSFEEDKIQNNEVVLLARHG